ncbi:hypothetical protein CSC82_20470 [Rhodobacteraceae bacterium 4F10]|nr:hypothetical protein CSC82_20470 [Rhodobacteraceae bacterium 4F10]
MVLAARAYGDLALETLARIAREGQSESARISAATQILDRAFGKPTQAEQLENEQDEGYKNYLNFMDAMLSIATTPRSVEESLNLGQKTPMTGPELIAEIEAAKRQLAEEEAREAGLQQPLPL